MSHDTLHFIQREWGMDGPYDRDGLCALLANGALHPHDRLLGSTSRSVLIVEAVITEAKDLYRKNCSSDRLVRSSEDRQQRHEDRRRTPLPDPVLVREKSVPPVADMGEGDIAHHQPPRSSDRKKIALEPHRRTSTLFLGVTSLLSVSAAGLAWYLLLAPPDQADYPLPDIPVLTHEELQNISADDLPSRLEKEYIRRMLTSRLPPLQAHNILSPTSRHVWNLLNGEGSLSSFGLQELVRLSTVPSANTSILPQMIAAYQAMGIEEPIPILNRAMSTSPITDPIEKDVTTAVQTSHRAVVSYISTHRELLFPDLYHNTPNPDAMPNR